MNFFESAGKELSDASVDGACGATPVVEITVSRCGTARHRIVHIVGISCGEWARGHRRPRQRRTKVRNVTTASTGSITHPVTGRHDHQSSFHLWSVFCSVQSVAVTLRSDGGQQTSRRTDEQTDERRCASGGWAGP